MKPKNECQREKRGRHEGDCQSMAERVKLCQSLAASDGCGNKRINEGMRGGRERGKMLHEEEEEGKRDLQGKRC